MRKIPSTMATQHPDNARAPFWENRMGVRTSSGDGFVSSREETLECMKCFEELRVGEYMWDWEGKYADEAVVDRLFGEFHEYFKKHPLGKEKFLTFRIPNVWKEKGHSLLRSLMVVLTAEDFARDLKFHTPPLFEIILPMTEKAEELMYIQSAFRKLARFKSETFNHRNGGNNERLEMIPLVESVEHQLGVAELLERYIALHRKEFKSKPAYLRPFLARSDPALISGVIATVLANKVALSDIRRISETSKIPMCPILGAGSLPFRGGLAPDSIEDFAAEYRGVRTATIQSAFRYDYDLDPVKNAIERLGALLPKSRAPMISEGERPALLSLIRNFERAYTRNLSGVAREMTDFFRAVPRRRERRQHIGLLRYARKMGSHELPRAINFTASFYSIGVPPEFIGMSALRDLDSKGLVLLSRYYRNVKRDFEKAGAYVNRENLKHLEKKNSAWARIAEDVKAVEEVFGIELGPRTKSELMHERLTASALSRKENGELLSNLITETGILRKSLG